MPFILLDPQKCYHLLLAPWTIETAYTAQHSHLTLKLSLRPDRFLDFIHEKRFRTFDGIGSTELGDDTNRSEEMAISVQTIGGKHANRVAGTLACS